MAYEKMIRKYAAGARTCFVCRTKPLPSHETWPGAKYAFCGKPECRAVLKEGTGGLYVGPSEVKCEGPECDNYIPEGRYDRRADFLACCGECWVRRRTKGTRLLMCGCGCGQEFLGRAERRPTDGLYFLSSKHFGEYLHNKYLKERCGPFLDLVNQYLNGFATLHYREQQTVRKSLGSFFLFLKEKNVASLEQVTPKTITEFLAWGQRTDRRTVASTISFVATFFRWAYAEGHCKTPSPVVPLIHRTRKQWRMPRPLGTEQLAFTWQLLRDRGNARLRLAAAIAEEGGLRLGEICRLRLEDVDLTRQRLFVRLPNKGNAERYAFLSDKTKQYYEEWMKERDPRCTHSHVLHNTRGDSCQVHALGQEFARTLCKTFNGQKIHEIGWDKWSTHALRHTMASNLVSAGADAATVMAAGGWKTYQAMCGYARVETEVARRGYEAAMKRAREERTMTPRKKTLTLSEYLDRTRKNA
jgi:integrase/recombinase XerC